MNLRRVMRHLLLPDWWALRSFPASAQVAVGQAVVASEQTHRGELRLVAEAGLPLESLLADQAPRARAIELFARLGVWDTEYNSGVLIYMQLIDRRVEIVADRGINARVEQVFWDLICRDLETDFRAGQFERGVARALGEITVALNEHFPAAPGSSANTQNPNELPDSPLII